MSSLWIKRCKGHENCGHIVWWIMLCCFGVHAKTAVLKKNTNMFFSKNNYSLVLSSIMHIWPVDSCPELNVILGATISTGKPLCSRRGQVYWTDSTLCSHVTDTEKVESIITLGSRTDKKLTSRVGWIYLSLSYTWQQEGLILPQVGRDLGEPVAEGRSF